MSAPFSHHPAGTGARQTSADSLLGVTALAEVLGQSCSEEVRVPPKGQEHPCFTSALNIALALEKRGWRITRLTP